MPARLIKLLFFLTFPTLAIGQKSLDLIEVSTITLHSPQLKTDRKIWICLPKNYRTTSKKYPVIYLQDAQNLFDSKTSFSGEWNVDETLDSLNAEVIVVGIEHGNDKRIDELTPYPNEKYGGGKADDYLDFIVNTVKPYAEKNYRIKTSPKYTAIGGSSLGGLFTLYALQKYPDKFQKGFVFSPAFWINPEMYPLIEKSGLKAKMYFLCGDKESEDMVSDMQKMIAVLPKTVTVTSEIVKDGQHNEKLWRDAFAKAYLWLFNQDR
ncbi:alpha/beta hydrolase-fold protein [Flavobacterium amniphilum]|uniref:alpha/beta hydrolase n=1 Tax=Flavobacterium amniphilum TaxID=1834035 RepID=UPI00202A0E5F|nr:alpha/beta hydrolase-fold protein [Flavobacterium amniphilum]MCL9805784.1 alpha/beta hydrolase-fold protein [Flavobacterium amniphilum]MCL9806371.1 alpha/beta hydrolase-fold protein [Flavobacterium amniphilum]